MGQTLTWERSEDNGSVGVSISDGSGPVTGATVVARFRDPDSADLWLDHNDNTWKANASVTTLNLSLGEVDATDAPGRYEANLDLAATSNFPAASHRIEVIYVVTSPTGFPVDVDVIELVNHYLDVAVSTDILNDATPFAGADVGTILGDTNDIQTRLPAALVGGRMDSNVGAMAAGTITAAAVATDAIDADALATDAVNEIRDSILSDSTPFAGANIDASISSRSDFDETTDPVELLDAGGAAGTSAAELVTDIGSDLSGTHGAGSWATATGFSTHTAADAADAVWDEAIAGHVGAGSTGEALNNKAEPGDAMDLVTDAVDAAAVATSAVNKIREDGCHIGALYNENTLEVIASVWLVRDGVVSTPTAVTLTWYNENGSQLFQHTEADAEIVGPDAQGVYLLTKSQTLLADTAYYVVISITDATGTINSLRAVPTQG